MRIDYKAIGTRVKEKRIDTGMEQEELAKKSSYTVQYIRNIERAHAKPSLQAIINIADALSVSIDDILCDSLIQSSEYIIRELSDRLNSLSQRQIKAITSLIESISFDMDS